MTRRRHWWGFVAGTLALGCGGGGSGGPSSGADPGTGTLPGGQSGTEGGESTGGSCGVKGTGAAGESQLPAPDEHIDSLSVSADDLFELVGGTRTLPGEWTAGATPVALTVDIREIDGVTTVAPCSSADFATVAHVFTSDGSIDASITNIHLAPQQPAELVLELPDFPASLLPPADATLPPKLTISIEFDALSDPDVEDATAVLTSATGIPIAQWSSAPWQLPHPVPSLYVPPDFMASACADAPAYSFDPPLEYTPLDSADQARSMAIGTWVFCQQPVVTGAVGFRVAEDGSVRDLMLDGDGIVVRGGFGHESSLSIFDTSVMNELPGLYQVGMGGTGSFGGYFWHGALAGGDYMQGVQLLLRTGETFEDAPNSFASMERAGSAACGTAEAGVTTAADVAALRQMLAGHWIRCSGSLPSGAKAFEFAPDSDTLTFEDAEGRTIDESSCQPDVYVMGGRYESLDCPDFKADGTWESWTLDFATRPLMVALTNGRRRAVFSALP